MQNSTTSYGDSEGSGCDPAEVCTLPAEGLLDRLAWIQREILPHAVEIVRLDRGLAIELTSEPGLAEKLDRLIELERECCSEIVFERRTSATPGGLRLEIHGIDPDASVFESLNVRGTATSARARFAKAAGAGVFGSLFVCCVLPIAAVALVGGVAAPLASLEGPGPIAVGAVLGGAGAWRGLGRRRPRGGTALVRES